jgi:hypothetical protein
VALHAHVGVEVVEGAVRLGAVGPRARVEALDLVVAAARPLADGVARERDEGVRLARGGGRGVRGLGGRARLVAGGRRDVYGAVLWGAGAGAHGACEELARLLVLVDLLLRCPPGMRGEGVEAHGGSEAAAVVRHVRVACEGRGDVVIHGGQVPLERWLRGDGRRRRVSLVVVELLVVVVGVALHECGRKVVVAGGSSEEAKLMRHRHWHANAGTSGRGRRGGDYKRG